MSSTVEEPDLFNDVEIMEVGDFTESDENYVSVELRSDDEDDDRIILEANEFSPPKSLLPNEFESMPAETSTYAMNSTVPSNRFLSDHEYLNDSTSSSICAPEFETAASEGISSQVEHAGSERFSVTYVEDLGMQDLFNKDNAPDGAALTDNETSDDDQLEIKIEIGEPQIQETIVDTEYIGNELIANDLPDEVEIEDDCIKVLRSLNNTLAHEEMENRSSMNNDHSYTTCNIHTPQSSDHDDPASDDERSNLRKLIKLSNKLASLGDVSTTSGKSTAERINKTVRRLLGRSEKNHNSVLEDERPPDKGKSSPTVNGDSPDRLSVFLSTNCSERLEDDEALPSSGFSANGQMQEYFGLHTDSAKGATPTTAELDDLLSLGNKFANQYEQWIEKMKGETKLEQVSEKASELEQLLQKINRQSEYIPMVRQCSSALNVSSSRCREISVQTDSSNLSKHMQQTLNEQSKQKLLDSLSSSSSDQSDSEGSIMARSSDSDRDGDEMMQEFVRSNRRLRKSAKEKRKASTAEDLAKDNPASSKTRAEQIYSDSSAEEEKHSERDGDENLLDDVLSGVDDIISDCPDVMGVMQDYFEKVEERRDRAENSLKQSQPTSDEQPNKEGSTKEQDKVLSTKHVKDMTESEREDYEDMQIERLCNISNIVVGRNASNIASGNTQVAVKTKDTKEQLKKKKDGNSMEQFLNDENGLDTTITHEPHSDESSESEKDVVETEEQFLQKCNENVKLQLLNQSSSSEDTTEEDSIDDQSDDTSDDRMLNGSDDEDSEKSASSLVDNFLKRHGDKITKDKEKKKRSMEETSDLENSNPQLLSNGQAVSKENMADMEKTSTTSTEKQSEEYKKQFPNDKELFKNDLFDDNKSETSDKKPRKKRKRMGVKKPRLSSDSELESSSEESDDEMVTVSTKKRQRKQKILLLTGETLDSSAPTATVRKDDKPGAVSVTNANDTKTKKSTISGADSLEKTASPAPGLDTASSTTDHMAKSKASKDGQDCISLSSDSSDDAEVISADLDEGKTPPDKEARRRIRPMLSNDELAEETKKAQKEEEGRVTRLKKKQEQLKKFLATYKPGSGESDFVLDYDSVRRQAISVHPDIVKLLKPHQVEGIQFMYDNTYGSVDALPKHPGSGCILAHCMGLGKTLQMITLLHTVMRYPQLMTNRVLVICPKSTVMNWKEEISRWQGTIHTGYQMRVYCFPDVCTQNDKISVLKRWFSCKSPTCGVMLIGYEAFRALINYERRKGSERMRSTKLGLIKEYLLKPGADLVICDEGHQIKNKRSAISEAVSKIQTKRRIILTGTPVQNNLKEYYCMVNFIKPSFLGSDKEFNNLYANPIKNGQCKDSDQQAIKIMKQRSYVLHNKLSKFVQRKEAGVLKEFLPEKFEYVLFVPLTPVQEKLYDTFLQMNEYTSNDITGDRTKKYKLIADYTSLRKIWTHPKVLEKAWETANLEKNRKDAIRKTATPDTDDEAPDDINDIASGQLSVTNDWWRRYLQTSDLESLYPSNKLWILFQILKKTIECGQKLLIFSAFVSVLNMVEHFMAKIHNQSENPQQSDEYGYSAFKGPWRRGKEYYRLDGKTPKTERHEMITSFNDPLNTTTKCFLISAKAGGQGINLTGANRVIILDTSWNPSNDQQNIFRIFRLGQKRQCYVYRLIAMGTMEEKVYSRSVTKQALSYRVVDEQQIDRHYSYGELAELYTLTPLKDMKRDTPILPADDVLASLLRTFPDKIFKYHEHDSLLENKPEQDLSEEEKKEAWAAYERERQNNETRSYLSQLGSQLGAAGAVGGLFGASQYGTSMNPYYPSLGYGGIPALPIPGSDMYRNDFSSYANTMSRPLYMQYGAAQQSYSSMLNEPAYASLFSKFVNNYPMTGTGAMDYALSSLQGNSSPLGNGQSMLPPVGPTASQGGSSGKAYGSVGVLASMLNYYTGKATGGSSGLPPSSLGVLGQSPLPGSASSSLGDIAAQHSGSNPLSHYNTLKQMSDYAQSNTTLLPSNALPSPTSSGLTISNITSLHKTNPSVGGSSNTGGGFDSQKSLFNRLSEQMAISPLATAGLSSPFSPRNVPLSSPTLDSQSRNNVGQHVPITTSSLQSFSNTSTSAGGSANSSVTTSSSQSVPVSLYSQPVPTITTGQGLQKNTKLSPTTSSRPTVENMLEAMRSKSTASILRPTSGPAVGASAATVIPIDEEDDLSSALTPNKQQPPDKRATGTNFGITYNKTQDKSTNSSSNTGAGKDMLKNIKTLSNNIAQQHAKPMSPKPLSKLGSIQTSQTGPPIIGNTNPSRNQLDRTNNLTALSSVDTSSPQQPLMKATVPIKPSRSSPTVNLTTPVKKPITAMSKPPTMTRSPLTVQTLVPTSKILPSVTTPTSSASSIVRSGNAAHRTAGTSAPISTTVPKGSSAVMIKSQPTTTSGAVQSINTTTTAATVTRTGPKPALVGTSQQQGKSANALQPSMSGLPTLTTRNVSNTTITQVKSAVASIPKPKIESRPMTLTMTPIKAPLAGTSTGAKTVKNPINPATITMPKLGQMPATLGIAKEVPNRSNTYRQLNVLPKAPSNAKATPVALLSTASMTGKVSNPTGTGTTTTTTTRLPSSASVQIPAVQKSSNAITTPTTTINQSPIVAKSGAPMSVMALPTTIINRPGKSPITMNAARTSVTTTKSGPMNIITTSTMQQPGSPRVSVSGSMPPSTMTVIPTGNITNITGLQRTPSSSTSTLTVVPSSPTAGLQRTASTAGSPTTSTMTVIPTANVTGMTYSYKDVPRKELVIHKAVASPTMRRILPSGLGAQQTTALKPITSASPSRTVLKTNVPIGNIIRAGTGSTTNIATTSLTGGVQSAPNCVFIRKRGMDSTTLDSAKPKGSIFDQQMKGNGGNNSATTAESDTPLIKRARREQATINPVPNSVLSSIGITNRISAGMLVKTKTLSLVKDNKKDDPTEVVVLE